MQIRQDNRRSVSIRSLSFIPLLAVAVAVAFLASPGADRASPSPASETSPADVFAMLVATQAEPAVVDMFLKLEGIEGESADDRHAGEIDVVSWAWGISQSGSGASRGGGAGKVNVQDISFTKYVDKSSPRLMEHIATGRTVREGVLTLRKAGHQDTFLTIQMQNVMVTSYQVGGSAADVLTEEISLNFQQIRVSYREVLADGSFGDVVEFGWDVARNEAL